MWLLMILFGCATKGELQSLQHQVDQLNNRVARIEQSKGIVPVSESASELYSRGRGALEAYNYEEAKVAFRTVIDAYPDSSYATRSERHLRELAIIGREAGTLEVERWFTLAGDFDATDTTLLVFFETWCPHCQREAPNLQRDLERWQQKGAQIIAITRLTRNTTDEDVLGFIENAGATYPIGYDSTGDLGKRFEISGIPAAVLIHQGIVRWRGHPASIEPGSLEKLGIK